ncbi:hypothetical protein KRX11_00270 [Pasteurellaceae bacterium TAE3-ERU1]|nr:hypothetical protein [Pasteurellaceae bacterium TAE3-ERU1]
MKKSKMLSNPFSTGGGGFHFESHIQASFVTLMLSGGYAPCLPCWPIVEIKLQGKIDGFDTDDLIVTVENMNSHEQRKLLGQIKHCINITRGNALFGEVIQAAWNDFKNPKIFNRKKDSIALITSHLSSTDTRNVLWLLNQARKTKNSDEFFRNVKQANFSPSKSVEKLEVFHYHLKIANDGNDVSKEELYEFLKHFYLLDYDLGNEYGVVQSLLHSHISQFQHQCPQWVWSRVVDIVQAWNQDAGTITSDNLPEELLEAFKKPTITIIPKQLESLPNKINTDWTQHPDATYLALVILLGSWQDNNQHDLNVVTQFLAISDNDWRKKSREILHSPNSPLSLNNGIWKVVNRDELWYLLGARILDTDLDNFKSLAISILKESDPAFELPTEKRYMASVYDKTLTYSDALRKGIAEGLAILSNMPEPCISCSQGKVEATSQWVIQQLLRDADWILWGSLNRLLPTLAEAAPTEFLDAVEHAMSLNPCPFDELFAQESNGITGNNYLAGLLWALESLAWEESYLVRICVVLAGLASHDLGGQWANRPSNSLITILLPWLPQTLASVEKRKVAVETVFNEYPEIAWNLIIQLLPDQQKVSFASHKPIWRKTIPNHWENKVTNQEYLQQVCFYAELAVKAADDNPDRLLILIEHFDKLPETAFDQLLKKLSSQPILMLPEEQRLLLWNKLRQLTSKHQRFSDAEWALPKEPISRIEDIANKLTPNNPFLLYQPLFTSNDFDLYEANGDWEEQIKKLASQRKAAILEIFQKNGIDGIIQFAESVSSPDKVGYALGSINDDLLEKTLLPDFLDSKENKHKHLVRGFIWQRNFLKGWEWCDNLDKSSWTSEQIGKFLACLPFTKETWDRASKWLSVKENLYWSRVDASQYQAKDDLAIAIEKLLEYGKPHAAICCLNAMIYNKQSINSHQCIQALTAALDSAEPSYAIDRYHIIKIIQYLQADSSANSNDICQIEWAYLPLLNADHDASPQLLELKLANDPEFYCEVIRQIYRSKDDKHASQEPSTESRTKAENAWRLLHQWKTPPGTSKDGAFSGERFTEWLQTVRKLCEASGHLEVALIHIGQVLIYTPADPNDLWIHRSVASALNDRSADKIRHGYSIGAYNTRSDYLIDLTEKTEKELAEQFRNKAEKVENVGFHRFATTLRELADEYDKEAKLNIAKYNYESE